MRDQYEKDPETKRQRVRDAYKTDLKNKRYNKKCNVKRGEKSIVQRWKTIKRLKEKFNIVRSWQKCQLFKTQSIIYSADVEEN